MSSLSVSISMLMLLWALASMLAVKETRAATNNHLEDRINLKASDNLTTQGKNIRSSSVKKRHAIWRHKRQVSWSCPDDWSVHNGSCYLFVNKLATWEEAKRQCQIRDACLAEVRNWDENNFLANLVINKTGNVIDNSGVGGCEDRRPKDSVWIGLTDSPQQGLFRWEGCGFSLLQWSNWDDGEPNNYKRTLEDCVAMFSTRKKKFSWNDLPCHCLRGFVCEKDALAQPPSEMSTTKRVISATTNTTVKKNTATSIMTTTSTEGTVVLKSSACFWNWQRNIAGVVTLVALLIIVAALVFIAV